MSKLYVNTIVPTSDATVTLSGSSGAKYGVYVSGSALVTGDLVVSGALDAHVQDFKVTANTMTFGDASGDTLTYNAATSTYPNGLTVDSAADIALSADGGNVTMDDGTTTIFDFNVDDTTLTIHDDQDTGDKFTITVAQHGATTLATTDDDSNDDADLTLDADGKIVIEAKAGDEVVFNEGSADVDFRVESNGNANMLFVNGGTDRVGIGTNSPGSTLEIYAEHPTLTFQSSDAGGDGTIKFKSADGTQLVNFRCDTTSNALNHFAMSAGSDEDDLVIDGNGKIGIAQTSPSYQLDVTGDGRFTTDLIVGDDLTLSSDSAVLNFGAGNDVTFTHDGGTGMDIASAGAFDINSSAGNISITADATNRSVTIKGDHESGTAIHLDGNAAAASIVDIDAGELDIDASGGINIASAENAADAVVITASAGGIDITATGASAGEDIDITATGSSVNISATEDAANAIKLHANGGTSETIKIHADQGSGAGSIELTSDAGGIDVNAAGAISLDSSAGSIDINVVDGQTVNVGLNGAVETIWSPHGTAGSELWSTINTAGTTDGSDAAGAILLSAVAGGIGLAWADDKDLWAEGGRFVVTANEDAAAAIKLHADAGTSQTILIKNDAGTVDGADAAGAINIAADAGGIGLSWADGKDLWAEGGRAVFTANEDAAAAIKLHADAGSSQTILIKNDEGTNAAAVSIQADAGGITLDAGGDIVLDADGDQVSMKFGGAAGQIDFSNTNSGDGIIRQMVDAKDLLIQQYDGTEVIRFTDAGSVEVKDNLSLKSDSAVLKFGANEDITLTHVADYGLTLEQDTDATAEPVFTMKSTGDLAAGPIFAFLLDNGAGEADDEILGTIRWSGDDSGDNETIFARIQTKVSDVTDGDEGGQINFDVMALGTGGTAALTNALIIGGEDVNAGDLCRVAINEGGAAINTMIYNSNAIAMSVTSAGVIFNEASNATNDFRIESDSESHFFFIDSGASRLSIGDSVDEPAAMVEMTNSNSGLTGQMGLLQLNNNDVDQIAVDVNAANTTADVFDITADALTDGIVIDITADALEDGGIINAISDSSNTSARTLVNIKNDNTAAVGATLLAITNDAIASTSGQTVLIESTANDANPLLKLKNSYAAADRPPILEFNRSDTTADANGMDIGKIQFKGTDLADNTQVYASILVEAETATSGQEGGKISFKVAENDGTLTDGLVLEDGDADGEIDVTIGSGTSSITTFAGVVNVSGSHLVVGDGSAADCHVQWNGNAKQFYMGLDDSEDELCIGFGGEGNVGGAQSTFMRFTLGSNTPYTTLKLGQVLQHKTITSDYTVTLNDYIMGVNTTSGDVTATLPTAADAGEGRVYKFYDSNQNWNGSSDEFIIDGASSETIDGAATKTITTQNGHVAIVCDGSNWFTIG